MFIYAPLRNQSMNFYYFSGLVSINSAVSRGVSFLPSSPWPTFPTWEDALHHLRSEYRALLQSGARPFTLRFSRRKRLLSPPPPIMRAHDPPNFITPEPSQFDYFSGVARRHFIYQKAAVHRLSCCGGARRTLFFFFANCRQIKRLNKLSDLLKK